MAVVARVVHVYVCICTPLMDYIKFTCGWCSRTRCDLPTLWLWVRIPQSHFCTHETLSIDKLCCRQPHRITYTLHQQACITTHNAPLAYQHANNISSLESQPSLRVIATRLYRRSDTTVLIPHTVSDSPNILILLYPKLTIPEQCITETLHNRVWQWNVTPRVLTVSLRSLGCAPTPRAHSRPASGSVQVCLSPPSPLKHNGIDTKKFAQLWQF